MIREVRKKPAVIQNELQDNLTAAGATFILKTTTNKLHCNQLCSYAHAKFLCYKRHTYAKQIFAHKYLDKPDKLFSNNILWSDQTKTELMVIVQLIIFMTLGETKDVHMIPKTQYLHWSMEMGASSYEADSPYIVHITEGNMNGMMDWGILETLWVHQWEPCNLGELKTICLEEQAKIESQCWKR